MELDGRTLDGAVLEAEVCVVGAGPCGLTLARALSRSGVDVVLLESGGATHERRAQRLNEGRVTGDRYAGLRRTRRRQIGGTATTWNTAVGDELGAKYVPLDPVDLASGSGSAVRWPLGWPELERWYGVAQTVCGLGPFAYEAASYTGPTTQPLELGGSALATRVYLLGRAGVFTTELPETLRAEPRVQHCHLATLLRLVPDRDGNRVEEAVVGEHGGARFRVRAHSFVLATGGIENARILLHSAADERNGWLAAVASSTGRWFMEHPRDSGLILIAPETPVERTGFYVPHRAPSGQHVLGRLAVIEGVRASEGVANASITFLTHDGGRDTVRLRDTHRRLRLGSLRPTAVPGSSSRGGVYLLLLNLEQAPHAENRVVLGRRRDAFGRRRAELHWRWLPEDQAGLERLRSLVERELLSAGLGRVVATEHARPDPNAHHHAGTTRMSLDASSGVVDVDCRVHGTENLFVCGSSVFPTAGYANPTLTVVALSLRLAARLARSLARDPATVAVEPDAADGRRRGT